MDFACLLLFWASLPVIYVPLLYLVMTDGSVGSESYSTSFSAPDLLAHCGKLFLLFRTTLFHPSCFFFLFFLGVLVCKTVPFVQTTAIVTGILTMTCIAIERYQGIVFPLKMRRQYSSKRAYKMLGILGFQHHYGLVLKGEGRAIMCFCLCLCVCLFTKYLTNQWQWHLQKSNKVLSGHPDGFFLSFFVC